MAVHEEGRAVMPALLRAEGLGLGSGLGLGLGLGLAYARPPAC